MAHIFRSMEVNKIYCGKMEEVLKNFPDNYCDSIVTDPPYGLSFMGKHWDYNVPTVEQWKQVIRVLKPGGFLLSFGGTRTYHRMVVNIEDAGFEIRDQIQWLYGSGFPKSLDISKAIDKQAGAEREITGKRNDAFLGGTSHKSNWRIGEDKIIREIELKNTPSTDEAKQWEGWGTALKPANEPICVARKPIECNTVAENVLKYGTGGLNIDGCRIELNNYDKNEYIPNRVGYKDGIDHKQLNGKDETVSYNLDGNAGTETPIFNNKGRFPANVILDEFMGAELDRQTGNLISGHMDSISKGKNHGIYGKFNGIPVYAEGDEGGASRFFYCPKPDNFERNKGLKDFEKIQVKHIATTGFKNHVADNPNYPRANHHPTVKPIDLMRYLVRLVTKKGGICLDPFCGSGTTLIAAKMELMNYIGIDMDEANIPLAEARVKLWNPDLYKPQELF